MEERRMKLPGPDHPISIAATDKRVTVTFNGETIAETRAALVLDEATLPPVYYVPAGDVRMDLLERTDRRTHCPYKGDASYYSVAVGGRRAENAVWSYEAPYPAVAEIKGRLAFYPDKVRITAEG
jgi:uncharacterized protein (DUF427 family)